MYKIQEGDSQARFICSSSKPNNLTPGNPYTNTCPLPKPSGSGGGGSGGGGSGGGGSGWENARKCSDVGITKASACGNQKYVCAHSDKNKTPDCNSKPFNCSNGRTKCLNE